MHVTSLWRNCCSDFLYHIQATVCDSKPIVFLFNFLKVCVLLLWGTLQSQMKTSINCYFGHEIFTLPLQLSTWGSYANLMITCVSETMLVKREQKYHNIFFLKNVRQSLLQLKCYKCIYEVCTRVENLWSHVRGSKYNEVEAFNGNHSKWHKDRIDTKEKSRAVGRERKRNEIEWRLLEEVRGQGVLKVK